VRGVQWWNSSPWIDTDPDAVLWTTCRAVRRARRMRAAALAFVVVAGAAAGVLAGLAIWTV
jgi:hypothetical protein